MSPHEKFSILVVDDEKSNIDVLHHILKEEYTVYVAKNGQNAIRMARDHIPDLILLDVIMPDMSGFEVLEELKISGMTRNIPVIFITGLNNAEDEEKGFILGAVDYITKPFHRAIVKARVRTHLKIIEQMRVIERLSMLDALTNIPNRRSFNDQLNREWGRAVRNKTPISLLIIDVDKFKKYNDSYGHPQGDALLQAISVVFEQSLKRSTDFVARWGGEEFTILLPETDLNGAKEIAEKIRANIENLVIPCADGSPTSTTVSIGVNSESPVLGRPVAGFVSRADEALYAAKASGRNRVNICD